MPITSIAAVYPDTIAARLEAVIQTSRSSSLACHSDSASHTASWVLPHEPRQSGPVAGATCDGVIATTVPGFSASTRPAAVSGLAAKPSASGGTNPERSGSAVPVCDGAAAPDRGGAAAWLARGPAAVALDI
jgi:hypothetical protein